MRTNFVNDDAAQRGGENLTMIQTAGNKHCKRCKGFCPSGLLADNLCSDCGRYDSPEEVAKREFVLALAARSAYWYRIVWNNSLL
jgi:hypothetical protein